MLIQLLLTTIVNILVNNLSANNIDLSKCAIHFIRKFCGANSINCFVYFLTI